jgi:hypothetical protein
MVAATLNEAILIAVHLGTEPVRVTPITCRSAFPTMPGVMYRETTWTRYAAGGLAVAASIGLAVVFLVPGDLAALGLIAFILGGLAAVACWSIGRYSGVAVSKTHLRAGRESVELSRLDRAFGVQGDDALAPEALAKISHIAFSGHVTAQGWRDGLEASGARLLGGAWGVPVGYKVLVVRSADPPHLLLAFASLHPERTRAALAAALMSRDTPRL